MKLIKYIFVATALMGCGNAFAQEKKIDTVEFNVVSKYRPVITDAVKLNNNPAVADTAKQVRKADYNNLLNSQFPTSYAPQPLEAMRMKGEPLDKLYHSFLSAGFGNPNAAYGEFYFNSLRSRNYDYGVHLNHFSENPNISNYGIAGFAYNDVNLFGETYIKRHILYAQADYDGHIVHDYGYDITKDKLHGDTVTRENYNYFGGAIDYRSAIKDSSAINHDIKVSGGNFSDIYNAQENNLNADMHFYTYYQKQRIDIIAFAHYYIDHNRKDTAKMWSLEFNPYFTAGGRHWDARLGLKVNDDPIQSKFYYYPDLIARYRVGNDAAIIYAGIDGKRDINSYRSLAGMNPYIMDTINLRATNTQYHLFAGFAGTITSNLSYDINGSQSEIDQMPLFVTDTIEALRNRFSVVYDKVRVINAHGDLNYIVKENLKFTLSGDYNNYTPSNQLKVWYHPDMLISLKGQYIYKKSFIFTTTLAYVGNQYAPLNIGGVETAKTINGYPDLNLGFEYTYSRMLSVFLNVNNIANVSYQRWLNYPTQGFNVLGGIRLAF